MHLSVCPFHFKYFLYIYKLNIMCEVRAHRVIQLSFKEKSMMEIKLMSGFIVSSPPQNICVEVLGSAL
jgi:hypothetical protein